MGAPLRPALVFIGFMGAGKTSAARAAAAALGARAVDSDHVLEERLGARIEDYFASHGERAFREAEEEAVAALLEDPPSPVLSLGGGAIGSVKAPDREYAAADFAAVDESPVRCLDPEAERAMVQEINVLRKANESLGGVFEVRAFGVVPGLGSHVSWEERLDGRIAGALASASRQRTGDASTSSKSAGSRSSRRGASTSPIDST